MSDVNRVLCLSTDADLAERLAAPLEWSYPRINVVGTADPDEAIGRVRDGDVDCVVTDYGTVQEHPDVLGAVRERHPGIPLLLLSEHETANGTETALSEVVDFLDGIGTPESDDAFGGWIANSVIRGPDDVGPPGGNRPEDVVRDVKRSLVDATAPMDIERAVCDQLTFGGRYTFAWIGEYDPGERQVVPWVTSAATDDWPTAKTFGIGTGSPDTVLERVMTTRQPQVIESLADHPAPVPWRDAAVERDCRAATFVPLVEDDELHGILGVYTDSPDGFSDVELSALREIGDATARVLGTMAIRGRIDQQERVLRRYERLVETVGDGMYALDADGHFMTVNDTLLAMTGYSREGLLGEHVSILLDEEDARRWEETVQRLLERSDREKEALEMTIRPKDGGEFPCENQVALLPREDGHGGTVGVLRDITERKRRERELQRQNERLEAFANVVSHDLRNPLSVAKGYVDVADESDDPTEAIENVRAGLERMEDIIGDVLALARHGQTVTETERVALVDVARTAWSNVSTHEAVLEVESSTPLAADRSRLLRVFENLFRNAVEHGREDVTVRVGALERAGGDPTDETGFYVADDGPGMPEEIRDHAFESSFSTSDEGLGLGLWVVREVASAHGWTIEATESRAGGARFEFSGVERTPEE